MAKKKAAETKAPPSAKTTSKQRVKSEPVAKPTLEKPLKPEPQRNLASEGIGHVAGTIWQQLDDQGELSIASIKSKLDVHADLVMAAIGWLAREDKLLFKASGRSVLVSLREV